MSENHIVKVQYNPTHKTVTRSTFQYDYGQVLQFIGFEELPGAFEVHFDTGDGKSVTMIGTDEVVMIPDECLQRNGILTAWLFLHDAETDGETRYVIEIPVRYRAEITNQEPTPVQQDAITQAIAALNKAVSDTEEARDDTIEAIGKYNDMTAEASVLPEGSEPTAEIDHSGDTPVLKLGVPKGEKGDDYILTEFDKKDIAKLAAANMIVIQDENPTDDNTKIWIPETLGTPITVPTVSEMNAALANKVGVVMEAISESKNDYRIRIISGV